MISSEKSSVKICRYSFGKITAGIMSADCNFYILRILDVSVQDDDVVLWAEADADSMAPDGTKMYLNCILTGFTPPSTDDSEYIKTVFDSYGLAYHIYAIKRPNDENDIYL